MAAKNGKLKPKMLKEFLRDNGVSANYENVLEGAVGPTNATIENDSLRLRRSRSRGAANVALTSFQKVVNAVKWSFHQSSTPLQRSGSVSRRLLGKWNVSKKRLRKKTNNNNNNEVMMMSVKVKDILRWRSFRDVVADVDDHHQVEDEEEEESQPLDSVVGSTDDVHAPPSSSNSYVDSEFTVTEEEEEELPWWSGDDAGKKWEEVVASDSEVGPIEDYHKTESEEGTEQQSPVSVLDSPFRDEVSDEEYHSTFDRSLANMERTKQRFLQSIQLFESLAGFHDDDDEIDEEEEEEEEDNIIDSTSKACLNRGFCWFKRGEESLKEKKECIQGMEMHGKWNKFEEERSEVGVEMEVAVLNDLLDEILFDF